MLRLLKTAGCAMLGMCLLHTAQTTAAEKDPQQRRMLSVPQNMMSTSDQLAQRPALAQEYKLLVEHEKTVEKMHEDEKTMPKRRLQPANKTEACLLPADFFDPKILAFRDLVTLWEGDCSEGLASGFGRAYALAGEQPLFEMLVLLRPGMSEFSNAYYYKNSISADDVEYFYGKHNVHRSSGISIRLRPLDGTILTSLVRTNADSLISYRKETSSRSPYVLNSMNLSTYSHVIYDMRQTGYSAAGITYHMIAPQFGRTGYEMQPDGKGDVVVLDAVTKKPIKAQPDHVLRPMEVIREIEFNIEGSIRDALEAGEIIKLYSEKLCGPNDEISLKACDKLKCKDFCKVPEKRISPREPRVRQMLLFLIQQHNTAAIRSYWEKVLQRMFNLSSPFSDTHMADEHIIDTGTGMSPAAADAGYSKDIRRRMQQGDGKGAEPAGPRAENLTPRDRLIYRTPNSEEYVPYRSNRRMDQ